MSRSTTRLYGALVAAVLGLSVSGCNLGADAARKVTSAPTQTPPHSRAPHPHHPLSPAGEVRWVGLRTAETPSAQQVRAPASGRSLAQPTLNQCGVRFASEAHRVARRQIWAAVPGSSVVWSSEVVAYDSAAAAGQALGELITATTHCTSAPVPVDGVSATFRIGTTVRNSSHLPVHPSYTVGETVSVGSRSLYLVVVYQQRGDVLDGNYLTSPRPVTAGQLRLLRHQAVATGRRLRVLPLRTTTT